MLLQITDRITKGSNTIDTCGLYKSSVFSVTFLIRHLSGLRDQVIIRVHSHSLLRESPDMPYEFAKYL
jgi:hypothetical protein